MAKPLIAGNWKMNGTVAEGEDLAQSIRDKLGDRPEIATVLCPPFIALPRVAGALAGSEILVGAQNLYPEASGAFTGEVSPTMLAGLCSYVIVGHSERRALLGETSEFVARKAVAAAEAGLRPVVCVGESLEVRDAGNAEEFVAGQLVASLEGVTDAASLVVGYEPVWAIGTGRSARPDVAQTMIGRLRSTLGDLFGAEAASEIPILYGGSVSAENVGPFVDRPDIDGALVGGASLKPDEFVQIVKLTASIRV